MLSCASYKSDTKDSIRSAEVQASNQPWDYAAHTHKLGDNLSRSVMTRKYTKFTTSVIRDQPTNLRPVVNGKFDKLARLKLYPSTINNTRGGFGVNTAKAENLQSSLMALGALSAFGAASYGMLRNHWERNNLVQNFKERGHQELQNREIAHPARPKGA